MIILHPHNDFNGAFRQPTGNQREYIAGIWYQHLTEHYRPRRAKLALGLGIAGLLCLAQALWGVDKLLNFPRSQFPWALSIIVMTECGDAGEGNPYRPRNLKHGQDIDNALHLQPFHQTSSL